MGFTVHLLVIVSGRLGPSEHTAVGRRGCGSVARHANVRRIQIDGIEAIDAFIIGSRLANDTSSQALEGYLRALDDCTARIGDGPSYCSSARLRAQASGDEQ